MSYLVEKCEMTITGIEKVSFSLKSLGGNEAHKTERRKIYIVKEGNQFLYVGEANTSIKIRFERSFGSYRYYLKHGKARGGYKGYKWIQPYSQQKDHLLEVFVAVFNAEYDQDREFMEAVKGELVFLTRQSEGYWPAFQNEIHFNNLDGSREIAEEIFKNL